MSLTNYFGNSATAGGLKNFFGPSRTASSDNLAKLEDWQLMAMAGGDPAEIERLRIANTMYGTGALAGVSRELGVEPAGETRGAIEATFDWMTRLQSGITGAATGALGIERVRVTEDEGRMLERPERESAATRFRKGITGEEKYRAADFRGLAYDRETTPTAQRAVRSATGFLLDVALDPLTYVSFGGSILGRKAGSVAVNAQARKRLAPAINSMTDGQKDKVIREAIARQGMDTSQMRASLVENLRAAGHDDLLKLMDLDKALWSTDELIQVARQFGFADSLAMDSLATAMASTYRAFGSGGLRSMMREGFGEAGEEMWRTLPQDLRGGLRIRVPFRRDASGSPVAFAVGDGRILDSLPGGQALRNLSNQGREYMRQLPVFKAGGDKMSGRLGAEDRLLASQVYNRYKDNAAQLWGQVNDNGTITWKNWNDLNNLLADFRSGSYSAMRHMLSDAQNVQSFHSSGVTGKNSDDYRRAFNELMKEDLVSVSHFLDESKVMRSLEDVYGKKPADWQINAYEAASSMQLALKRTESVLMEAFDGSIDEIFKGIEQYWPRIADDVNRAMGKGKGGGGANLLQRERYIGILDADPAGKGVLRWMTPPDIMSRYGNVPGARVFEEDPVAALLPYLVSMHRLAATEKLTKNMLSAGLLFRGGAYDTVRNIDEAVVAARDLRGRLLATEAGLGQVGRILGRDRADAANSILAGVKAHGRKLVNHYVDVPRPPAGVQRAWAASDGSQVHMLPDGSFRARGTGFESGYLTVDGGFSKSPNQAAIFPDRDSAELALNNSMREWREKVYVRETQMAVDNFMDNLTDSIRHIESTPSGAQMYDPRYNVFQPDNVPMDQQEQWFDEIIRIFERYGDKKTYRSRGEFGEQYRRAGYGLVSAGTPDSPQMQAHMQKRFSESGIFSSEGLVDGMRLIWKAQTDPTPFGKWVDGFYKPFYQTQKALMTSQRGPGYVARNIVGGMWNAYLVGVRGKHWSSARAVQVAAENARDHAAKQTQDLNAQYRIAAEKFDELLSGQFGKDKSSELQKAWETYQLRGGARSIASRTAGVQAVGTPTGVEGGLTDPLLSAQMTRTQRVAQKLTSETAWARFTTGMAQDSEDFLRFGTFLKGVDDFGLDDGGYAAYMLVKASQFDYADLSSFEADVLKMIVPFYTWSRNNVPLQIRALASEPGKVAGALRINEALRDAFGEYDPEDEPLPAFVRERFGWRIRQDLIEGPAGDALAGGLVIGEPLIDLNRLVRSPSEGFRKLLNLREVGNNLNPAFGVAAEAITGIELSTGGRMPRLEEAPIWARPFATRDLEGTPQVSSKALRTARSMAPPLAIVERLFPGVMGNERLERRVYTSWASQMFGLPVSTLDPYQTGAELRRREQETRTRLQRVAGETTQDKIDFLRPLIAANTPPQDLALIRAMVLGRANATPDDFLRAPADLVDPQAGLKLALQIQGISRLEDPVVRAQAFTQLEYKPRPVAERGRGFLTEAQLAELGLTPQDVGKMSRTELLNVLDQYVTR
jgi:hypothetical protein